MGTTAIEFAESKSGDIKLFSAVYYGGAGSLF